MNEYVLPLYDAHGRVVQTVPVSEDVYRFWWRAEEKECYQERRAQAREISYQKQEAISDEDYLAWLLPATEAASEHQQCLIAALREALAEEPPELCEALLALANGELTQEALAQRWGVSQRAVSYRIERAYNRLRRKLVKKK